jgi:hypothetical protein
VVILVLVNLCSELTMSPGLVLLGSTNYDESVVEDPEVFDLDRMEFAGEPPAEDSFVLRSAPRLDLILYPSERGQGLSD